MRKGIIIILKLFLLLLIIYVFHFADRVALEQSYRGTGLIDYHLYEDIRIAIHIVLWIVTFIFFAVVLIDFMKKKRIIKTRSLSWLLLLLAISIASELPIYSCYTAGVYESFWKPFHFH